MSASIHFKSLVVIFCNLDKLIEQARYNASRSAAVWLKKFRKDVVINELANEPCNSVHYDLLSEKECNQQIIENFKECFRYTILFLHDYAADTPLDMEHAHLFNTLHKKKLITHKQLTSMLWTHKNIEHLCNACDEQGEHIVSTQLIESYYIMHAIVSKLNAQ